MLTPNVSYNKQLPEESIAGGIDIITNTDNIINLKITMIQVLILISV